jgi:tetratricopeptide (TPR) repeat protein
MSEQNALVKQWVDKAEEQYHRERFEESLITAQKAISVDENYTNAWWFCALNLFSLGRYEESKTALEEVIDRAPNFANAWARYGAILQIVSDDKDDEDAKTAFETALECDESHLSALTSLAAILARNNSDDVDEVEKETEILNHLYIKDGLTPYQLNRLGGLHYHNKNFFEAIKIWERNINDPSSASLFNLGLAFNHPEVSQDADAIDIWRLTLKRKPDYERAQEKINKLLPRLIELSENAHSICDTVLKQEQYYLNYINPFQLLNHPIDTLSETDALDFKKTQKLRKRLLQEVELEDGCIHWLSNIHIDRSKAISICDELHDKQKLEFHRQVYNCKPLLRFLTLGEHAHFCVDKNHSPIEIIELLDDSKNGFREWLSKPFSNQLNQVLSIAIESKYLDIIEVLLDGRRWITLTYTESCFINSKRKLSELTLELASLEVKSEVEKPVLDDVSNALNWNGLLDIMNLLPTFFWDSQDKVASAIRQISINSYNHFEDSDLSRSIIKLTGLLSFKSEKFNHRLKEDIKAIENIIDEERKNEVNLTIGYKNEKFNITKNGVCRGDKFISIDNFESVRWGSLLTRENSGIKNDSLFVFNSLSGEQIKVCLTFKESDEIKKGFNTQIADATLKYIFPKVLNYIVSSLKEGSRIRIGHIALSKRGVSFEKRGFIFNKEHSIPWQLFTANAENGEILVQNTQDRSVTTSVVIRDVDNAFALLFLAEQFS